MDNRLDSNTKQQTKNPPLNHPTPPRTKKPKNKTNSKKTWLLIGLSTTILAGTTLAIWILVSNKHPKTADILQSELTSPSVQTDTAWKPLKDLPPDYNKEQAIADGVYVNVHGAEIHNQALIDTFYTDALNGIATSMRTFEYTVEGDPIINDYRFDGTVFTVTTDTTRDKFASPGIWNETYKYLLPYGRSHPYGTPQPYVLSNEENIYTDTGTGEITLIDGLGSIPSPSNNWHK